METAGDYQFFGLAYSNVSGFQTKNGCNVGTFDVNYGLAVSGINFEAEALITDKGVVGINNSSAVSPQNISGVPFFSSIRPSPKLIYDGFFRFGTNVASWSVQTSYIATIFNRRVIPYVDYSQILQNTKNYSYQYDAGLDLTSFMVLG